MALNGQSKKICPEKWYTANGREPLGVHKKHFTQFRELNFEALEANEGQNAPETSGEVALRWEQSRKIPGEILTYFNTKKVQICPF